jgi:hypothetical protein
MTVLQARNRGGWLFENVHHSYMIVLVTSVPNEDIGAHIWPAIEQEQAIDNISLSNSIYLSYEDLANLTTENRLVIPWFDDSGARDVFPKMEQQARLARDEGWITGKHDSRWDFTGSGPHSHLVYDEPEPNHWRVFMTRSVDQFKINEEKEFRRFVDPEELYEEGRDLSKNPDVSFSFDHPTVTFRYVTMNDNTRTMIATMLPEQGFIYCKGYIHAIDHDGEATSEELLALLAYLNSFTCDWWLRRIVDRHMNSPMTNNLPIPDWDDSQISRAADLAAELTRRGGIDSLPGGHPVPSNTGYSSVDEDEIRAKIESLVTKGFELKRDELDTVLRDFSKKACSDDLRDRIRELAEAGTSDVPAAEQNDD